MKAKFRIKILQEVTKAKGITLVDRDLTKKDSYRLRTARDSINNKINFYKGVLETMEKRREDGSAEFL